ncbi:MAG: hypothetical protein WC809_21515 [Sinimarinibacterium sp.]|jgi:hypothetical protein
MVTATPSIETRAVQAEKFWSQGDAALAAGDRELAYRQYTNAHDLITDCPALHERAHRKLKAVTKQHGERGEYLTDSVLLALAPFGIFRLIAIALRSKVGGSELCRTRA